MAAKILVVEDNPKSAKLMDRILTARGYQVVHASTGLEGLRLAVQESVDLVLLDLMLPDIGGELIAALLDRYPSMANVPVIAVTAKTGRAAEQYARMRGCDGYITKPIDTRRLPETIAQFLNGSNPKNASKASKGMKGIA
jgi:two-component system cell cycle response regulator/two-component system cell cycle response regulator DivK